MLRERILKDVHFLSLFQSTSLSELSQDNRYRSIAVLEEMKLSLFSQRWNLPGKRGGLFSVNISSEKQTLPRIFDYLRTAIYFSRWSFHSCTILKAFLLLVNCLRLSEVSLIFHISLPRLGYFSYKGNLKLSDLKNVMEGDIRKILTFVI